MVYILAAGDLHAAIGQSLPYARRGRSLAAIERGLKAAIAEYGAPEAIFGLGDLTEGPEDMRAFQEVLRDLQRLCSPNPLLVVPGNHDPSGQVPGPFARELPPALADVVLRDEIRQVEIGGESLRVLGLDYVRGRERRPVEALKALKERLATQLNGNESVDILLTHLPPFKGISDGSRGGRATGSRFVDAVIRHFNPRVVLYGHYHEGAGEDLLLNGRRYINLAAQTARRVYTRSADPRFWPITL